MAAVGLVYDPIFLEHAHPGHPERPERLLACVEALRAAGLWDAFEPVAAPAATEEELARIHSPEYLRALLAARGRSESGSSRRGRRCGKTGFLDADTYLAPASVDAALRAAGGCRALVHAVVAGRHRCGLALVRPPGHHAERDRGMGFCLLGNAAFAAAAARDAGERVAIVDIDVHHGNGTQHMFERDPRVLFVSLHRWDGLFYPGSGAATEVGVGEGRGATLNVPLTEGAGAAEYLAALDAEVAPALQRFRPGLLLVSAGFDAHERDPLGGMALDDAGYEAIVARLAGWARELCGGRWVAVLEGGYDLQALGHGIVALARSMVVLSTGER
jgi:acetoin utilization deacetylase AcuC-like enzyme